MNIYKSYKYWEVLHLYEHVIVDEFWRRMHEGGWIYFEDYSILGFTWPNSGITEISLKSKNENIYSEFEKFMDQNLQIEDWEIEKYANQIFAEEQSWRFDDDFDLSKIRKMLNEIHASKYFFEKPILRFKPHETSAFSSQYFSKPRNRRDILRISVESENAKTRDFLLENLSRFIGFSFGFYHFKNRDFKNSRTGYFSIGAYSHYDVLRDFDERILDEISDFLREYFSKTVKSKYFEKSKVIIRFNQRKETLNLDILKNS